MIVKQPEERFPAAPEGSHSAICVDIIDLGLVKTVYNGEERERKMARLVWQIEEEDAQGKRYLVKQDYTASLDEKAKLRKHLQAWRGRSFTKIELFGFDLESIIGTPCMLSVVHNQGSRGGTFANVDGVMKLPKGMTPIKANGYVRVKDRETTEPEPVSQPVGTKSRHKPPEEQPPNTNDFEITDDDVPF